MSPRKPGPDLLDCFAVAPLGLERLLEQELKSLGLHARATTGGAAFQASPRELYRVNLLSRTASRVLLRVASFRATAFFELEKRARAVDWQRYIAPGRAVSFRVSSHASRLYHQGAIAERLLEAAVRAGGIAGAPAGDDSEAEGGDSQLFVVRAVRDQFVVSVDASGAPLHRRGYRQAVAKAPLRETLAAAMLLASRWDLTTPLIDPMCGSGTIPIEAALLARRIPPGLADAAREPRRYAFESWAAHDPSLWESVVEEARAGMLESAPAPIQARDRDGGAIRATHENAERAGVLDSIDAERAPLSTLATPDTQAAGALVTNPPYGKRVGDPGPLRDLYATLGKVARSRLPGWTVALLSADRRLDRQLDLPLETVLETRNGGIPVRLMVGQVTASAG